MIVAALIGLQVGAALPSVVVRPKGDGFRAEAGTFELEQSAAIHAEIEGRASELCAGKSIKWGEFGSLTELGRDPGSKPAKISGYYQEFSCVTAERAVEAEVLDDWKAGPGDETDARRFFETYYARRDAGDIEGAYSLFAPEARPESSKEHVRDFNRSIGSGNRRITRVTWYVNPPEAPRRGAYVALDFVGEYAGVHVYCGYLMLYRLGAGRYEIVREEQNMFERGDGSADPYQIESMRAAVCRGL